MVVFLNQNAQVNSVVISGYTDRIGAASYNLKLSQKWADAVKQYFLEMAIAANRLTAIGKGESNPVVECFDKRRPALIACLAPNRRVEIEKIDLLAANGMAISRREWSVRQRTDLIFKAIQTSLLHISLRLD